MQQHLLVLESNTTGTGLLLLEKARDLGYAPFFLTNNPRRYRGLESIDCPVVTGDTNSIVGIQEAIARYLPQRNIRGITTTSEFYLEMVAQLAAIYNLPGNSPEAVAICRNKARTREVLAAAQIHQPRFAIVRTEDDLDTALRHITLPFIVKPADDTGSNQVVLCHTAQQARQHTHCILGQNTNVRGQHTLCTVLIEEYLDGPEFSVEMFTWRGETICVGITRKGVTGKPYFVEHQHIFPATLAPHIASSMQESVRLALEAVGITSGPTHTEVKLTPDGQTAIIEINARLAGGMIPELIRHTTELDLLEEQLHVAVGEVPHLALQYHNYAGIQFLLAPAPGIFKGVRASETIREPRSGICEIATTMPIGSRVSLPRSAYDRLGYIICTAPTYEEVEQRLHNMLAHVEIVVAPPEEENSHD